MALIKKAWMPECGMKRIICHWTAGGHKASAFDKQHYHILIESDGRLVRGPRSIADNVSTADGVYAAHTRRCNTRSIGISVCCMAGARQRPFKRGRFPMTKKQWETMTEVAAELCDRYGIEVTPKTVLGHGEVEKNLNIRQNGKWDPMVLPWDPGLSPAKVGRELRRLVKRNLAGAPAPDVPPPVKVVICGKTFTDAIIEDGTSYVMIRPVANALGWRIESTARGNVTLKVEGKSIKLPMIIEGSRGYVGCRDLGEALGMRVGWNSQRRAVVLR